MHAATKQKQSLRGATCHAKPSTKLQARVLHEESL